MPLYKITDRYSSGNPKHYKCSICELDYLFKPDDYFEDNIRIDKHLEKHWDKIPAEYKCEPCKFLAMTKQIMKNHIKEKH